MPPSVRPNLASATQLSHDATLRDRHLLTGEVGREAVVRLLGNGDKVKLRADLAGRSYPPNMRLFHFSDDSAIATFTPRSVMVPSQRAPGMEWLNGPLVWAIEERVDFMYLFPRDCPRILIWATEQTSDADKMKWLGGYRAAAYIERDRLPDLAAATLHRYDLPTDSFEDLHDAGMWVSRGTVKPLGRDTLFNLPSAFAPRGVDLRVIDSLLPLKPLWETTLHASGIRLRNARGWA